MTAVLKVLVILEAILEVVVKDLEIPSVFNNLLKPPRQLELPHISIPYPGEAPSLLGLSTQKTTLHTFLISIHNRNVIPKFTPLRLQDN